MADAAWAVDPYRCRFTVWRGAKTGFMELVASTDGIRLEATGPDTAQAAPACSDCVANPGADYSRRTAGTIEYAAVSDGKAATIVAHDRQIRMARVVARISKLFDTRYATELRLDPARRRLAFKVACGLGNTWFGNRHGIYVLSLPNGPLRLVARAERGPLTWLPDGSGFLAMVRDEESRNLRVVRVILPEGR